MGSLSLIRVGAFASSPYSRFTFLDGLLQNLQAEARELLTMILCAETADRGRRRSDSRARVVCDGALVRDSSVCEPRPDDAARVSEIFSAPESSSSIPRRERGFGRKDKIFPF